MFVSIELGCWSIELISYNAQRETAINYENMLGPKKSHK